MEVLKEEKALQSKIYFCISPNLETEQPCFARQQISKSMNTTKTIKKTKSASKLNDDLGILEENLVFSDDFEKSFSDHFDPVMKEPPYHCKKKHRGTVYASSPLCWVSEVLDGGF